MVSDNCRCVNQCNCGIFTLWTGKCVMEYGEIKLWAKRCSISVCVALQHPGNFTLQKNKVIILPFKMFKPWKKIIHLAGFAHRTSLLDVHNAHRYCGGRFQKMCDKSLNVHPGMVRKPIKVEQKNRKRRNPTTCPKVRRPAAILQSSCSRTTKHDGELQQSVQGSHLEGARPSSPSKSNSTTYNSSQ